MGLRKRRETEAECINIFEEFSFKEKLGKRLVKWKVLFLVLFVGWLVCCFLIFFFPRRRQPQKACKLKETIRKRNQVVKREGKGRKAGAMSFGQCKWVQGLSGGVALGSTDSHSPGTFRSPSITAQGRCYREIMRKSSSCCHFLMIQEAWLLAKKEEDSLPKSLGERKSWWIEERE